ncbi:minichromosome maintenance domain-containing protein 2 isoform X2 [Paramormyrops kingsleyae]|uniref:minichromosome maintenance domain-containing protein 2 isoform X2 n=1 Tax=Paramormyrops kingsleyae TaxID=1676925 RepID=UPI000CD64E3A|nr:minichromosome maintenance domain-containing protein 2 isoform X2 [Paramormyrops kingsleyae]
MAELLEMKVAAVSYLDRSGGLRRFIEDCKVLGDPQQTEAVYRFCITVNPSDVIETDARLGDWVLHDSFRATALFQSVCFLSIKTLSLIEKIDTENQVNVVLKLMQLPLLPGYMLDLHKFPRVCSPMRPQALEGLAIAMTRVTKYTQGARFLCTQGTCPCSTGFHHIRVHTPGATESATVRSSFTCKLCSSPLREDMKSRVLGDKQMVEMIDARAVDILSTHPPHSLRYQSVTLFLRDELCDSMKIGKLYRVVGIPAHVHQWPHVTWSIEASSVQPWEPKSPGAVSSNFQSLLVVTSCSPWRFTAVMASMFGSPVVPPGLYSTLKLCLLLSLVQTRENEQDSPHYLDVLALSSDTLIIDRLMTYSLALASRGIRHQASGEMLATLSEDEHGAGTANIHAGAAFLATGGICLLGDLATYRKDKLEVLQSVLETRTASVFFPAKKYGEDTDQKLSFSIQCSFWALGDTGAHAKRTVKGDSIILGSMEMGSVPAQLAETFGLVVQCRHNRTLLPLTVHTLRHAITPGDPLYPASMQFTTQDYQDLLDHARSLQVELSPQAERMIHGYFAASRRLRSSTGPSPLLSAAYFRLLVSMAEAHCKLSLRTRVSVEDAVVAVLLCEASLTLKYGASALTIPPEAVFPCDLHDFESLHQRDMALDQLHQQILHFIYAYAPGAANYITEE